MPARARSASIRARSSSACRWPASHASRARSVPSGRPTASTARAVAVSRATTTSGGPAAVIAAGRGGDRGAALIGRPPVAGLPGVGGPELHQPRLVAGAVDEHVEAAGGKRGAEALRPLDDRDPLVAPLVEDAGGQGVRRPRRGGSSRRGTAARGRACSATRTKRRRRDRLVDLEPAGDPADQLGLAGAERPDEGDDVARGRRRPRDGRRAPAWPRPRGWCGGRRWLRGRGSCAAA